jgi:16S rRNA (uracil1498-N3)-methyltransferase
MADEFQHGSAALTGSHARHLARVLRAKVGQQFEIATGGEVRRGTIRSIHPDRVEFTLGERVTELPPPPVTVALAVFKFDRMEWAVEKCTELGVRRLIPLLAERSQPHLAAAAGKRVERWQRIARQAAEQSRRSTPPEIAAPQKLAAVVTLNSDAKIVLAESEHRILLKDAIPPAAESLLLAVGPEGGWKGGELASFQNAGWTAASLGQTILRTETAAVAAVAIAGSILQRF